MSLFVDAFNNSCNPFSILVRVVRSIIIDNGWCTRLILFFYGILAIVITFSSCFYEGSNLHRTL